MQLGTPPPIPNTKKARQNPSILSIKAEVRIELMPATISQGLSLVLAWGLLPGLQYLCFHLGCCWQPQVSPLPPTPRVYPHLVTTGRGKTQMTK